MDAAGATLSPCRLRKGRDAAKDQSYFLFGLTQEQLQSALFPVGHLEKAEVRRLAREAGLGVALKAESQELCFVPDGDYAGFVERSAVAADRGGPILDTGGREIGRHAGVHRFTVGQRRRLGLASSRPLYLAVRPESHAVVVGSEEELLSDRLFARDVNWLSVPEPAAEVRARARIRYRHAEADASIRPLAGGRAEVRFDAPQRAVTPGQAVVFYDGDVCLGSLTNWSYSASLMTGSSRVW